jgi:hypothetical protein
MEKLKNKEVKDRFRILENGNEIDILTLELVKNKGGFDYGNGNSIVLTSEKYNNENLFDARYDGRFNNEKLFHKNSIEFIKQYVRKDLEIIKI